MRNVQIELIRLEVKYCENLAVCGVAEEEIRGFTVRPAARRFSRAILEIMTRPIDDASTKLWTTSGVKSLVLERIAQRRWCDQASQASIMLTMSPITTKNATKRSVIAANSCSSLLPARR
jgi:hypothetical protein